MRRVTPKTAAALIMQRLLSNAACAPPVEDYVGGWGEKEFDAVGSQFMIYVERFEKLLAPALRRARAAGITVDDLDRAR